MTSRCSFGVGECRRLVPVESPFFTWLDKGSGPALGDAGLFSTTFDYARFAQMLLNGGALDGKRVLGRKTVEFMHENRLGDLPRTTSATTPRASAPACR